MYLSPWTSAKYLWAVAETVCGLDGYRTSGRPHIAPLLPPYHLAQLALDTLGAGRGSAIGHIGALVAFTALFIALAAVAYRRDEGKLYG